MAPWQVLRGREALRATMGRTVSRGGAGSYVVAGGHHVNQRPYASVHYGSAAVQGDGGSFSVSSGASEKLTMQELNGRLASYMDKVQSLEAANEKLERQIQEVLDRKCPGDLRELDRHLQTIDMLQAEISERQTTAAQAKLQLVSAELEALDLKVKTDQEHEHCESLQADLRDLWLIEKELRVHRLPDLHSLVNSHTEELKELCGQHQEDVRGLLAQVSGGVAVGMQCAESLDLNQQLEDLREHSTALVTNNLTQNNCWYNAKMSVLSSQEGNCPPLGSEVIQAELNKLRKTTSSLEEELMKLLAQNKLLENSEVELIQRYRLQLAGLQQRADSLGEELDSLLQATGHQAAEFSALLNTKTRLETEIEDYRTLLNVHCNGASSSSVSVASVTPQYVTTNSATFQSRALFNHNASVPVKRGNFGTRVEGGGHATVQTVSRNDIIPVCQTSVVNTSETMSGQVETTQDVLSKPPVGSSLLSIHTKGPSGLSLTFNESQRQREARGTNIKASIGALHDSTGRESMTIRAQMNDQGSSVGHQLQTEQASMNNTVIVEAQISQATSEVREVEVIIEQQDRSSVVEVPIDNETQKTDIPKKTQWIEKNGIQANAIEKIETERPTKSDTHVANETAGLAQRNALSGSHLSTVERTEASKPSERDIHVDMDVEAPGQVRHRLGDAGISMAVDVRARVESSVHGEQFSVATNRDCQLVRDKDRSGQALCSEDKVQATTFGGMNVNSVEATKVERVQLTANISSTEHNEEAVKDAHTPRVQSTESSLSTPGEVTSEVTRMDGKERQELEEGEKEKQGEKGREKGDKTEQIQEENTSLIPKLELGVSMFSTSNSKHSEEVTEGANTVSCIPNTARAATSYDRNAIIRIETETNLSIRTEVAFMDGEARVEEQRGKKEVEVKEREDVDEGKKKEVKEEVGEGREKGEDSTNGGIRVFGETDSLHLDPFRTTEHGCQVIDSVKLVATGLESEMDNNTDIKILNPADPQMSLTPLEAKLCMSAVDPGVVLSPTVDEVFLCPTRRDAGLSPIDPEVCLSPSETELCLSPINQEVCPVDPEECISPRNQEASPNDPETCFSPDDPEICLSPVTAEMCLSPNDPEECMSPAEEMCMSPTDLCVRQVERYILSTKGEYQSVSFSEGPKWSVEDRATEVTSPVNSTDIGSGLTIPGSSITLSSSLGGGLLRSSVGTREGVVSPGSRTSLGYKELPNFGDFRRRSVGDREEAKSPGGRYRRSSIGNSERALSPPSRMWGLIAAKGDAELKSSGWLSDSFDSVTEGQSRINRHGSGEWIVYSGITGHMSSSAGGGRLTSSGSGDKVSMPVARQSATSPAGAGRFSSGGSGEWKVYSGSTGRMSSSGSGSRLSASGGSGGKLSGPPSGHRISSAGSGGILSSAGSGGRLSTSFGSGGRLSGSGSGGRLSSPAGNHRISSPRRFGSTGSGEWKPVYSGASGRVSSAGSGGRKSGTTSSNRAPSPGGRLSTTGGSSGHLSGGSGGKISGTVSGNRVSSAGSGGNLSSTSSIDRLSSQVGGRTTSSSGSGRTNSMGGRVISSSDRQVRSTGSGVGANKERISVCKMAALSISAAGREKSRERQKQALRTKQQLAAATSPRVQRWLTTGIGSTGDEPDDLDDIHF
ncbi:uncharacterized protein ACJ7VT_021630 [Polymixia lowei]